MDFYSRYDDLCRQRGIDPCSQKTAEMMNTTRANISNWKKGTKPSLDRVRDAADMLHTTADYLLGRTDDPTDFTLLQKKDKNPLPQSLIELLKQLDHADMDKATSFVQGLLAADKYQKSTGYSGARAI